MQTPETISSEAALANAIALIYKEHEYLRQGVAYEQLAALIAPLERAQRIFLMGMGRSGFMMQALGMRLMHLGFNVHIVGETTAPAITNGDVLLAGSGSGSTTSIVNAAKTAKREGAAVLCFTTNMESLLADLADVVVVLPAAQKNKQEAEVSQQYAGSLFEQALLLYGDALIQLLWNKGGKTADQLWQRHANLE